jgi:hypothetical protein
LRANNLARARSNAPPMATNRSLRSDPVRNVRRHFIIPFSRIPSSLDPAGPRLDVVKTRSDVFTRCLAAALICSRGTRNDTTFTGVFLGGAPRAPSAPSAASPPAAEPPAPCALTACGAHVRALKSDQPTLASILSAALPPQPPTAGGDDAALNSLTGRRGCCAGFWLSRGGLRAAVLRACARSGGAPAVLILAQGAPPLEPQLGALATAGATSIVVLLGDDAGWEGGLEAEAAAAAEEAGAALLLRAALGPTELLASACITIAHYVLDVQLGGSATEKPGPPPAGSSAGAFAEFDAPKPCPHCLPLPPP